MKASTTYWTTGYSWGIRARRLTLYRNTSPRTRIYGYRSGTTHIMPAGLSSKVRRQMALHPSPITTSVHRRFLNLILTRREEIEETQARTETVGHLSSRYLAQGREGADRRESVALVSPHRATFRKVVFLSESGPTAHPSPPLLKKAKGNFETQRLGTLSGACRDMQAARFFFLLSVGPVEARSAGCSRCGWGCILARVQGH